MVAAQGAAAQLRSVEGQIAHGYPPFTSATSVTGGAHSKRASLDHPGHDFLQKSFVPGIGQAGEQKRVFMERGAREALGYLPREFYTAVSVEHLAYPADLFASAHLARQPKDRRQALAFIRAGGLPQANQHQG